MSDTAKLIAQAHDALNYGGDYMPDSLVRLNGIRAVDALAAALEAAERERDAFADALAHERSLNDAVASRAEAAEAQRDTLAGLVRDSLRWEDSEDEPDADQYAAWKQTALAAVEPPEEQP